MFQLPVSVCASTIKAGCNISTAETQETNPANQSPINQSDRVLWEEPVIVGSGGGAAEWDAAISHVTAADTQQHQAVAMRVT